MIKLVVTLSSQGIITRYTDLDTPFPILKTKEFFYMVILNLSIEELGRGLRKKGGLG
jgi:hypothetical protein